MLRLIYYAIIVYLVFSVVRFFRRLFQPPAAARPKARLSGVMVKDEACDTYVPREEALREVIEGKEYFFCSRDCRKKFLEAGNAGR